MMTGWGWEQISSQAKPAEGSVRLCMRGDLVAEKERLEEALRRERQHDVRENRVPVAPDIARQILAVQEEAEAAEVEFTFRALGRKAFSDLVAAHPATKEQEQQLGQTLDWNPETFPPALAAASCSAPEDLAGHVDRWTVLFETLSMGQWTRLWRLCNAVNAGAVEAGPKSELSYAILAEYEPNSTTAVPVESPEASSSAG